MAKRKSNPNDLPVDEPVDVSDADASVAEDAGAEDEADGGGGGRSVKSQLAQGARVVKDEAGRVAKDALRQTRASARDVGQAARAQAQQVGRELRERGQSLLDDQKNRAVAALAGVGSALGCAAERLEEETGGALAAYVHSAADRVAGWAEHLRQRPAQELLGELQHAARRRPEWVVGGMFVAGLALARFAQSAGANAAAGGPSPDPDASDPDDQRPDYSNVPMQPAITDRADDPAMSAPAGAAQADATAPGGDEPNAGTGLPGDESGLSEGVVPEDPSFRDRRTTT